MSAAHASTRLDHISSAFAYLREAIPEITAAATAPGQSRGGFAPAQSIPPRGLLYGPNGSPIYPDSTYSYRRKAARREGSMQNWIPQRLISRTQDSLERERIVERSVDLSQSDPHAAGVATTFATMVIGTGLTPLPLLDSAKLVFDPDPERNETEKQRIRAEQKAVHQAWYPYADAGRRGNFGGVQYSVDHTMVVFGEYLVLIRMIDDPLRPYSIACHVINPLRLKTPIDLRNDPRIADGVELGPDSEAVAYWIKKSPSTQGSFMLPDVSANFERIPVRTGHRVNVLHGYIQTLPEQVRALPMSAPAMKFFLDHGDLLDAELVSNVVTAALAVFIEVEKPTNPFQVAGNLRGDYSASSSRASTEPRYQELIPGAMLYGSPGQKPHLLAAARPGQTFEPFTRIIKKAIAMAHGIPYPVLFKDVEGVNFAGFRSAMLDAWRTFMIHRTFIGQMFCQPIYTMLQEEAYLRGDLRVSDFYTNMAALTRCEWRGSAKGDIEPVKAIQANVLAIESNLKTHEAAITEMDGDADVTAVFDQLAKEKKMLAERDLNAPAAASVVPGADGSQSEDGNPDEPGRSSSGPPVGGDINARMDALTTQVNATLELVNEIREYMI
jgi:lambda family phage portal protein